MSPRSKASAMAISRLASMSSRPNALPPNFIRRVLTMVPELEEQNRRKAEQNFKNKMEKNGFVHLNRNIYYHRNRQLARNPLNRFYIKNQGPRSNANIIPRARALLKQAINVHYQAIPREEAARRPASVRLMKQQLKNMVNELHGRGPIFLVPARRPTAVNTANARRLVGAANKVQYNQPLRPTKRR